MFNMSVELMNCQVLLIMLNNIHILMLFLINIVLMNLKEWIIIICLKCKMVLDLFIFQLKIDHWILFQHQPLHILLDIILLEFQHWLLHLQLEQIGKYIGNLFLMQLYIDYILLNIVLLVLLINIWMLSQLKIMLKKGELFLIHSDRRLIFLMICLDGLGEQLMLFCQ